LKRCAFLCGAAKEGFQQKKFSQMYERLLSEGYLERDITLFPNGVDELMLECALNGAFDSEADEIFLYFCADSIKKGSDTFFLRDEEIRFDVISYYESLAKKIGSAFRVVYDCDDEMISETALGWEKVAQ